MNLYEYVKDCQKKGNSLEYCLDKAFIHLMYEEFSLSYEWYKFIQKWYLEKERILFAMEGQESAKKLKECK